MNESVLSFHSLALHSLLNVSLSSLQMALPLV